MDAYGIARRALGIAFLILGLLALLTLAVVLARGSNYGLKAAELAPDTFLVRVKVLDVALAPSVVVGGAIRVDSVLVHLVPAEGQVFPVKRGAPGIWGRIVWTAIFAGTIVGWAYVVSYAAEH